MRRSFCIAAAFLMGFAAFPASANASRSSGEGLVLSDTPPGERGRGRGKPDEQVSLEHRASARRTLYLNARELSPSVEAYVLRADGSTADAVLLEGTSGWTLPVDTLPMDGSLDGIFNIYVVERTVVDGTLTVRVGKANMINHSCGWRHPYKFDQERLRAKSLASVPLEITGDGLWDANFHSKTMSGDRITFTVLSYGKPVPAAPVVFETGSGWRKTARSDRSGRVTVQLIRDYFPETWRDFDDRKKGSVLLTATCDIAQPGVFAGTPYSRVHMITTLPWKYQPARQEYTSYAWGLGIAALFAVFAGAGTFMYREHRSRPYREGGLDAED